MIRTLDSLRRRLSGPWTARIAVLAALLLPAVEAGATRGVPRGRGLDLAGVRDHESLDASGGIGGLLAIRERVGTGPETTRYVISEPQGNVMALADPAGTLVARFDYDPFGRLIMETGESASCSFRYSTKYRDPDLELYCYGHRWYDPASMKWLTPDPIGERGGVNLTAFCANDPVNKVDALGMMPEHTRQMGFMMMHLTPEEQMVYLKGKQWEGMAGTVGGVIALGVVCTKYAPQVTLPIMSSYPRIRDALLKLNIGLEVADWVTDPALNMTLEQTKPVGPPLGGNVAVPRVAEEVSEGLRKVRQIRRARTLSRTTQSARRLATGVDEAVFWSGIEGGAERAADWAARHGGATLETTLSARGIRLPAWVASNPAVVAAWRKASTEFAAGARGNVRVIQGDALRIDAIWRDEFRALISNANVNSIRAINPETGVEVLLWAR